MVDFELVKSVLKRVDYVLLIFSDLVGGIRGRMVSSKYALKAFVEGVGFDGSSVPGFSSIEESDLVMRGDLTTLGLLPEYVYGRPVAIAVCNIFDAVGNVFPFDSRGVCRRWLGRFKDYFFRVAAEVEFYLVRWTSNGLEPVEHVVGNQYFNVLPNSVWTERFRLDFCDALRGVGVIVEREGHEVGAGQNEITFKYAGPVGLGDHILYYRFLAKSVAAVKYGWIATFMPKPWIDLPGNGMHIHVSLFAGGKNLFYDPSGYAGLSQVGRYFVGGLIDHARALCAVVAPTVNSYKRLVPKFEAPVYACWGWGNRSVMVRIPKYFAGDGDKKRIEFRCPDPLCNPYFALVSILEAGMDGIKRRIDPGDPVNDNVYNCSGKKNLLRLPKSLFEALEEWKSDEVCVKALGREVAEKYLELKMAEWKAYKKHKGAKITAWEHKYYLYM